MVAVAARGEVFGNRFHTPPDEHARAAQQDLSGDLVGDDRVGQAEGDEGDGEFERDEQERRDEERRDVPKIARRERSGQRNRPSFGLQRAEQPVPVADGVVGALGREGYLHERPPQHGGDFGDEHAEERGRCPTEKQDAERRDGVRDENREHAGDTSGGRAHDLSSDRAENQSSVRNRDAGGRFSR